MADLSIKKFVGAFSGSGARPNLYEVQISDAPVNFSEPAMLRCKGAVIPASTVGQIPVAYMGRTMKVPGDKEFADITLTFYNDIDWDGRMQFETWLNLMNRHDENTGYINPEEYYGEIIITQLSKETGEEIQKYEIHQAFPTEVSEITLGYDQNDQVEEYTVTFAYNYYTHSPATN